MDRITESLLKEFSTEFSILHLPEQDRFEQFASYVTVKRHHNETFDPEDIVTGGGDDTAIDGIAIIVNSTLVTDVEALQQQIESAATLEVQFIFVQAERTAGFDGAKIGSFGFGVGDFFRETPTLRRNAKISDSAEIMTTIYDSSGKFNRGNPTCRLYHVTTGKWTGDRTLEARRQSVIEDLEATNLFSTIEFVPLGAEDVQRLYRQTKNAISKEFAFVNRTVIPEVPGVTQAYIGFLPAQEFLKLLQDDAGELLGGLFYDNVRDWQHGNCQRL